MNEIFVVGHLITNRQSIITMKAHFSIIYINGTHKVVLNCYATSIGWCFTSNGQYSKYIHADYTLTSGFFFVFFSSWGPYCFSIKFHVLCFCFVRLRSVCCFLCYLCFGLSILDFLPSLFFSIYLLWLCRSNHINIFVSLLIHW